MKTNSRRGVTLVELLIAMSLSTVVLGAVMSTYLYIARSSVQISNYSAMEREATLGLEQFGRDLRMTQGIVSSGTPLSQVTLTVPDATGTGSHPVVYAYNSAQHTFTRTANGKTSVIVRDIQAGTFGFKRFDLSQSESLTDYDTNQLQITLTLQPATYGLVTATTKRVISSRFVLRNR